MTPKGSRTVSFRLTEEEYQALEAKAAENACSVGEWAREMALSATEGASRPERARNLILRAENATPEPQLFARLWKVFPN